MYIPFDEIDFNARVWVYQANRNLTPDEVGTVTETLKAALEGWQAHQQDLLAAGKVFLNRFVVLAVDESQELPSGCSIDKSVHWLQEIGTRLGVDFFDRSVAYLDESGHLQTLTLPQIKAAVATEQLTPNTTVFDNLVATKAQWMSRWKVRAADTWLKRYFVTQAVH
ncbi:MAG: hypothetical protein MUE30_14840 [Spirosomaceae bacterium]|jgi:hypothetical protein|nr:hypothetical protein [Spirosomataceae bacterium]